MSTAVESQNKFNTFKQQTLFALLPEAEQSFLESLFERYRFTFQEFRQLVDISRDLEMWGEGGLRQWLEQQSLDTQDTPGRNEKERFLNALRVRLRQFKAQPKSYAGFTASVPEKIRPTRLVDQKSEKKIFGWCPVASEKTVCCNLRTIDAVETCAFGCSYCTIQTFYSDKVIFEPDLKQKLAQIQLDPRRRYHIGTGQSSDSLVWGNRNGEYQLLSGKRGTSKYRLHLVTKSPGYHRQ